MLLHAMQPCVTRKIRVTLCGRRGVVYSHKANARLYCDSSTQGRFRIAGRDDTPNCQRCAMVNRK